MGGKQSRRQGLKKTLEKLKDKLETPQPCEKKIRRPAPIIRNPWNPGDIYAYQFHSPKAEEFGMYGKYIVFQKIGEEETYAGEFSRVQIFDKLFEEIPEPSDLEGVRLLPVDNPENFPPDTFIGNQPDDRGMPCYKGPYATKYGWDYMEE